MTSFVGFVVKINSLTKKSQKPPYKPYTLYSMRVADKDGNEIDSWFQCGFSAPSCQEGDYIKFDAEPATRGNPNNHDVKVDSIQVSKNPPANPAAKSGGGTPGGTSAPSRAAPKTSELFGEIGGYNTEDDIRRMSYSAARDHALAAVALLLENDGLAMPAAKSKAGQTARFDTILAAVDKLTVEYFYDSATGRKLESVDDSFVEPEGDGPLPDAEDDGFDDATEDEFDDDIPFE